MSRPNVLHLSIALVGLAIGTAAFGAEPTTTAPAKPAVASTAATGPSICKSRIRPCAARRQARTGRGLSAQAAFGQAWGGTGPWGAVSTVGQSVGMSAFTAR